jgi:hypothetical protein
MGLTNYNGGGKYITVLAGKFCQRVADNTEGAVQRVNKEGKVVFEKYYDAFTGKLVDIKTQDGAYGKNWLFSFRDKEDTYNLQLGYSNGYAVAILKMLPNVDITKEFKVSPKQEVKDGKTETSLFINQDGKPIKHFYTKDNPNGLPQWEQITVKGQQVWDSTKQLVFLENMVKSTILPKLAGLPQQVTAEQKANAEFDNYNKVEVTEEEIPF